MVELASIMYKINAKLEFLEEWGLKPKRRFVRGGGGRDMSISGITIIKKKLSVTSSKVFY